MKTTHTAIYLRIKNWAVLFYLHLPSKPMMFALFLFTNCLFPMFQGRLYSYSDTHRHRLGSNYLQIPVNCPFNTKTRNYQRDGPQVVTDNQGGCDILSLLCFVFFGFVFFLSWFPLSNWKHYLDHFVDLSASMSVIEIVNAEIRVGNKCC